MDGADLIVAFSKTTFDSPTSKYDAESRSIRCISSSPMYQSWRGQRRLPHNRRHARRRLVLTRHGKPPRGWRRLKLSGVPPHGRAYLPGKLVEGILLRPLDLLSREPGLCWGGVGAERTEHFLSRTMSFQSASWLLKPNWQSSCEHSLSSKPSASAWISIVALNLGLSLLQQARQLVKHGPSLVRPTPLRQKSLESKANSLPRFKTAACSFVDTGRRPRRTARQGELQRSFAQTPSEQHRKVSRHPRGRNGAEHARQGVVGRARCEASEDGEAVRLEVMRKLGLEIAISFGQDP